MLLLYAFLCMGIAFLLASGFFALVNWLDDTQE